MKRIPAFKALDIFRGFAALWVVMDHCCDRWLASGNMQYLSNPLYAFSIKGGLGVTLFFVISGYCITSAAYSALVSGKSLGRYCFERVRRIYPPYVAAMILTALSGAAIIYANAHHLIPEVNHLAELPLQLRFWIANLLLLQYELKSPMINVVFWSLCYEISFYAFIGLFLQGAKWIAAKRGLRAGTVFFICCVGITTMGTLSYLMLTSNSIFPFDLWHQFSMGGLLFFLIDLKPGTVENYTAGFRRIVLANVVPVVLMMAIFGLFWQLGEVSAGFASTRVRCFTCLFFTLILMVLRRVDEKFSNLRVLTPFMWLGAFSYSLYLVHPIVIPYVDILSRRAGLDGHLYWIAFCLQMIVAVFFGRVFYVLIERRFISKRQVQRLTAEHVA